jgi:hypothetical protein
MDKTLPAKTSNARPLQDLDYPYLPSRTRNSMSHMEDQYVEDQQQKKLK